MKTLEVTDAFHTTWPIPIGQVRELWCKPVDVEVVRWAPGWLSHSLQLTFQFWPGTILQIVVGPGTLLDVLAGMNASPSDIQTFNPWRPFGLIMKPNTRGDWNATDGTKA